MRLASIARDDSVEPVTWPAAVDVRLMVPVGAALAITVAVLVWVVRSSESAWMLLGAGRGLIAPEYYPLAGFVLVLATTLGQAVGWAGGTAVLYYVMILVGLPRSFSTWRLAMTVVYLGLGIVPLLVYHVLFGGPLLGLPREGLAEWLLGRYPDAHWLLVSAHPFVDWAVVPLGIAFLALLWLTGDAPRRHRFVQGGLALALLGTSLAVALSLAIHSTLVHVRIE